jgi:ribosomal protein S18 acetylase RimI-like enzyme
MLAALDAEHVQHYRRAPVFMAPRAGLDVGANASFVSRPKNSVWLALDGELAVGFLRFDGYDFDSVAVLESDDGVLITGAYVRPAYRRRNVATALLQAGLQHYAALGLGYCAVNFESFNPEAASFWPKYFEPVCLSLMRVPET